MSSMTKAILVSKNKISKEEIEKIYNTVSDIEKNEFDEDYGHFYNDVDWTLGNCKEVKGMFAYPFELSSSYFSWKIETDNSIIKDRLLLESNDCGSDDLQIYFMQDDEIKLEKINDRYRDIDEYKDKELPDILRDNFPLNIRDYIELINM